MAPSARDGLLLLYGSQSGCAEEVAHVLASEAFRRRFRPRVHAMDEYDVSNLPHERLVVCVASTTGEGEVPDNMRSFWQFLLRRDLPRTALSQVKHTTFGLGDSSYPKFNYAAKRLHRRLEQLGSTALLPIGLGDDQDDLGVDHGLGEWVAQLWPAVETLLPLPPDLTPLPATELLPARYEVQSVDHATGTRGDGFEREAVPMGARAAVTVSRTPDRHRPWTARVLRNERLMSADCARDVRHIEFDLAGSKLQYEPGDALAVQPRNDEAEVRGLLLSLGFDASQRLRIRAVASHAPPLPRADYTSLELFRDRLDTFGVPRRPFFALLAHFATDQMQAEKLAELGSAAGAADLAEYATQPRRTCAEVLRDFTSARPPLEYYLDLIPPLRERYFSISSSPLEHPTSAHITVAVVRYRTMLQAPRKGVCSSFLAALRPETISTPSSTTADTAETATNANATTITTTTITTTTAAAATTPNATTIATANAAATAMRPLSTAAVWLRRGCLRLPDASAPMVMIGPGTGVAPFRAFVRHRMCILQSSEADARNRRNGGSRAGVGGCAGVVSAGEGASGRANATATAVASAGANVGAGVGSRVGFPADDDGSGCGVDAAGSDNASCSVGPSLLFFGCRKRHEDFLYASEWSAAVEAGALTALHTAFSREDKAGKVYVQHRMREPAVAEQMWRLLRSPDAHVYIAGAAGAMPRAVRAALVEAAVAYGGMGDDDAAAWLRALEAQRRLQCETW